MKIASTDTFAAKQHAEPIADTNQRALQHAYLHAQPNLSSLQCME